MSNKDNNESINKNKLKSNKSKKKFISQSLNMKQTTGVGFTKNLKTLAESNKERNKNGTKKYNNNNIINNNNNNNSNSNRQIKPIRNEKEKVNEIGGKKPASIGNRNKRQNNKKIKNSVNNIEKGNDYANNYGYESRIKNTNKEEIEKKEISEEKEKDYIGARQIILDRKNIEILFKKEEERQKKEKEMKEKEEREKREKERKEKEEKEKEEKERKEKEEKEKKEKEKKEKEEKEEKEKEEKDKYTKNNYK